METEQVADDFNSVLPETTTHSFVIKIWLEKHAEQLSPATWRGYITHVPGGERRYLKDLDQVIQFVEPYLESMGVKLKVKLKMNRSLVSRWWVRWRR